MKNILAILSILFLVTISYSQEIDQQFNGYLSPLAQTGGSTPTFTFQAIFRNDNSPAIGFDTTGVTSKGYLVVADNGICYELPIRSLNCPQSNISSGELISGSVEDISGELLSIPAGVAGVYFKSDNNDLRPYIANLPDELQACIASDNTSIIDNMVSSSGSFNTIDTTIYINYSVDNSIQTTYILSDVNGDVPSDNVITLPRPTRELAGTVVEVTHRDTVVESPTDFGLTQIQTDFSNFDLYENGTPVIAKTLYSDGEKVRLKVTNIGGNYFWVVEYIPDLNQNNMFYVKTTEDIFPIGKKDTLDFTESVFPEAGLIEDQDSIISLTYNNDTLKITLKSGIILTAEIISTSNNETGLDTIAYTCDPHVTVNMAVYRISSTQVDTSSARDTIAAEMFVVRKDGNICYCSNNGTSIPISGLSDGSYYLGDSGNLTTTKPTEKHQFIGTVFSNIMTLNIGDFFLGGVNTTNDELTTYYEQKLPPTDQKIGDLWWKTTSDSILIYNGYRWQFVNTKGGCPVINAVMSASPVIDLQNRDCATFILDAGLKNIYNLSVINPKVGGRYIFDFRNAQGTKKDVIFPNTFRWENMKILDALTITETAEMVRFSYDGTVFRAFEPEKSSGFVTTWRTENTSGSVSDSLTIELPLIVSGTNEFLVNWGDGVREFVQDNEAASHTYANAGTYTVSIYGTLEGFTFDNGGDKTKLITVENYGPLAIASLGGTFHGCSNLISVPLNGTAPRVLTNNISDIFSNCSSLDSIDLSGMNTSGATAMSGIFSNCTSLKYLNIDGWDFSSATTLGFTFYNCNSLEELDVSNWDVGNVTSFTYAFNLCSSLQELDVSNWDVSSANNLSRLFGGCTNLSSLGLTGVTNWNVTSSVSSLAQLFNSTKITTLDLQGWDVSGVSDFSSMFTDMSLLTNLNLTGWTTTAATNMAYMFTRCTGLSTINVSTFDVDQVTNFLWMFNGCTALTTLDLSSWTTTAAINMTSMFTNCISLDSLDCSSFDLNGVTSINSMFSNCSSLEYIGGVPSWDVSTVTDMGGVFNECTSLDQSSTLDFDTWDVSNVNELLNFLGAGLTVSMTTANYDAMLIAWDALTLQSGVTADFGGSQYTLGGAAETARTNIITGDSWLIDDNGGI
jgi:surface protein